MAASASQHDVSRAAKNGLDIVAVLVELSAFAILTVWGFLGWSFPWNIVVGLAAPALAVLAWALFVSPRAVFTLHPFVRAVVELAVYASATIALWDMGLAWVGLGYAVIAITVGLLVGRRQLTPPE